MEQVVDYEIGHKTLVFERHCAAPVKRVFAAFADPVIRAGWSAPSDGAVFIYDAADFREGGEDRFRCGSKENPQYTGRTTYIAIVPDVLLVSSEVVEAGGRKLMSSLITTELAAEGDVTTIRMTVQVTSLFGDQMIVGTEIGNNAALDNLVEHLV
ncbi:SRPBCC domain-containing protein [Ensifer adhaerens]|uniref:SRPBCC domain-containing protein n=1 Tax=Ensifer adhaerens TaxID=106592 RepID=UPI000CF19995|nr:SRPBCC domain-containing protein [Ensifer adhaerens]